MLLLAEATSEISSGNVIIAVLTVASGIITYLAGKDRLKFSSRTQDLETSLKALTKEVQECEAERKQDRERIEVLTTRCERAEIAASSMKGEVDYLKADNAILRKEYNDLRDILMRQLNGKNGGAA